MKIIDSPTAMAHALVTFQDPWLRRRLSDYRDRLIKADCEVGDLGPSSSSILATPCWRSNRRQTCRSLTPLSTAMPLTVRLS